MQGNVLHDCYYTWTKFAKQRAKLRRFLVRFLGGKEVRQMAFALRMWNNAAMAKSKEEMEFNQAGVEELREQVLVLQAELEMANQSMGDLQRQKQISGKKNMKKIVSMWRNKLKLGAFASWRTNAQGLRSQRKLLKGTMLRMLNVKLDSAFSRWGEQIALMKRIITVRCLLL